MIKNSSVLYINSTKHQVLKQVDNKFLLDYDKRLIVHDVNQNRSTGILYVNKVVERVIVSTVKKIKYIGDDKKWKNLVS